MPELITARGNLIRQAAGRLALGGIPDPRREALRIWTDLTGESAAAALLGSDSESASEQVRRFERAVERRSSGEPLAHVTGWIGFRHLTLRSDARALIPRPETEGLVDLLLGRLRTGRVVDVGTGTGCIALSLALEGAFSQVLGVDRSSAALLLAAENRCLVGARVDLIRSDFCSALRREAFDALISNPPYLTAGEYAILEPAVRDWEPASALEGGEDGLEATEQLLLEARRVLRPGGLLALEVDSTRAQATAHRASALEWQQLEIHTDLFGRERYLLARRSNTR